MDTSDAATPRGANERHRRRAASPAIARGEPRPASGTRNVGDTERGISVAAGAALLAGAVRRRDASAIVLGLAGAVLAYRGATGHCPLYQAIGQNTADDVPRHLRQQHGESAVLDARTAIRVERSVTIDRPREELYRFWRQLDNLPQIMQHLESVTVLDERRSRWTAKAPVGQTVEWTAVINHEEPNVRISWKSEAGATVPNAGSVRFADAPGGRGTEIHVTLEYDPPAGRVGQLVARLFGEAPAVQVREDLRRFKAIMETGEAPTNVLRASAHDEVTA